MSGELIIYGAGGAGRELAFALTLDQLHEAWSVKGFVDDTKSQAVGERINGIPILGGFEYFSKYAGDVAVCIVRNPQKKKEIIERIKNTCQVNFPTLLSSHSIFSPFIEWGEGCIASLPYNFISPNVKIGNHVFINCGTRIGHDTQIGDYTTIYSGIDIGGAVSLGSCCIIGSGVTILPNVRIGEGSIIGAGSVVSKDIPDGVVVAGVPARIIRELK